MEHNEIKMRNEKLKSETYAQYFKHSAPNQSRLMSAFDIEEGNMQMSYMHPTLPQPKSVTDYKKATFEVLAKGIHPVDQIEFHKQVGGMIYSTLAGKAMDAYRLQDSLNNTIVHFKLEKASSSAKDTRIKSLEDLIIELGHNPKDIKATE